MKTGVAASVLALSVYACSSHTDASGPEPTGVAGSAGSDAIDSGTASEMLVNWYVTQVRASASGCLPEPLPLTTDSTPNCKLLAATSSSAGCDCGAGRTAVSSGVAKAVVDSLASIGSCDYMGSPACSSFCVCEVQEATDASKQDCLNNETTAAMSSGWCYVAPAAGIGSTPPVAKCPANAQQTLRFLGNAQPKTGEIFSLACGSEKPASIHAAPTTPAALGGACTSSSEYDPSFPGFSLNELSMDLRSPGCQSGICLQDHFQGRVSCPYGQPQSSGSGCLVPGTQTAVTAETVPAQYVARSPAVASTCSCRCAGSGNGPFCSCPSGMQCAPLITEFGLSDEDYAGSYCIPEGSAFKATELQTTRCDIKSMNCGPQNQ